jgi:A/G-specific adenine glycosylase
MPARRSASSKSKSKPPAAAPDRDPAQVVPPLLNWFLTHARDLPWRRTLDPYAIWISEIMLQQTQVKTVIPYFERWRRDLPDLAALANAPEQRVLKLWEGLGYYTRARNLQKAARKIVAQHGGTFPHDFDAILALPGIGRYTAGAIASIAFNQPKPILDGNVIRVLTRLFAIRENPRAPATNARLWQLAEQLVGTAHSSPLTPHASLTFSGPCSVLNQSLMELGAIVCTPRAPACLLCPVRSGCAAHRLKLTETLPNLDKRAAATDRRFHTFIARHDGKFLVHQRPRDVVNAGLWEFPNLEPNDPKQPPAESARTLFGETHSAPQPFATLKHSITRYRITQEVFITEISTKPRNQRSTQRWLSLEELTHLPFTSAHKKLLSKISIQEKPGSAAPQR